MPQKSYNQTIEGSKFILIRENESQHFEKMLQRLHCFSALQINRVALAILLGNWTRIRARQKRLVNILNMHSQNSKLSTQHRCQSLKHKNR